MPPSAKMLAIIFKDVLNCIDVIKLQAMISSLGFMMLDLFGDGQQRAIESV
jgi:hypothetical protein